MSIAKPDGGAPVLRRLYRGVDCRGIASLIFTLTPLESRARLEPQRGQVNL